MKETLFIGEDIRGYTALKFEMNNPSAQDYDLRACIKDIDSDIDDKEKRRRIAYTLMTMDLD